MLGLLAAIAGAAGGIAHIKASHDNREAEEKFARAERVVEAATKIRDEALKKERQKMGMLASKKKSVISGNMQRFVKYFSKIKPVNFKIVGYDCELVVFNKNQIAEIGNMCAKINKIPANEIVGGVSGAMLAVGAADMLAGGSLLGGSVAIGGTTVAVGTLLGTVAAPVFAITGINSAINASKNLDTARSVLSKANAFEDTCYTIAQTANAVSERCDLFYSVINEINNGWFTQAVDNLVSIVQSKMSVKNFWKNAFGKPIYTEQEMKSIASTMALAKMLKTMIDTSILDSSGKVTQQSLDTVNRINSQIHNFNPQEILAKISYSQTASTNAPTNHIAKPRVSHNKKASLVHISLPYLETGKVKPYVVSLLIVLACFFTFYLPANFVFSLAEINPEGYKEILDSHFMALLVPSMVLGLMFFEISISIPFSESFSEGTKYFLIWAFLGIIPLLIGSGVAEVGFSEGGTGYGIFCIVIGGVILLISTIICMITIDNKAGNIILLIFEVVTSYGLIYYCRDIILLVLKLITNVVVFFESIASHF